MASCCSGERTVFSLLVMEGVSGGSSMSFNTGTGYLHLAAAAKNRSNAVGLGNWMGGAGRAPLSVRSDGSKHDADDVDRRKLLLTSLAATLSFPLIDGKHPAFAAPLQPPNLQQCKAPINGVNCCLPVSTTITDFKLPTNPTVRVRLPAHNASKQYIAQYENAYQLLRKLPTSDPRQFAQQANVHRAFCDSAYVENGTSIEYQVHNSWLFFPWHRWFLYFHERILASVLKDPNFSLPFWNWDSSHGSTLPPMYAPPSSPLYDANRNPKHVSPATVDLNYNLTESGLSTAAQLAANNTLMYRQFVSGSKTPSLFFGQPLRQGGVANPGAGTIENIPHGTVHVWTGNPANANDEDMGALYSAARDPCFFAHHANLDRLWEVWKSLGERRKDITDPDWLNATFLFYDENAKLVRVRIGDALDTKKLGYKYGDVPNVWLNKKPTSSKSKLKKGKEGKQSPSTTTAMGSVTKASSHMMLAGITRLSTSTGMFSSSGVAMAGTFGSSHDHSSTNQHPDKQGLKEFKERNSKQVENTISVLVKRPKKVRADDYEEEILVFKGVEVPADEKVKFDVYINISEEELKELESEEGEGRSGPCDISEYAGSFFNIPHLGKTESAPGKKVRKSNFKLGIGEVLKELGLEEVDSFIVTIVPRTSSTSFPISIEDVIIEYE